MRWSQGRTRQNLLHSVREAKQKGRTHQAFFREPVPQCSVLTKLVLFSSNASASRTRTVKLGFLVSTFRKHLKAIRTIQVKQRLKHSEIICRAGEEPAAALFVLMGTLENSTHPKVLANAAKHCAFTPCGELTCLESSILRLQWWRTSCWPIWPNS